MWYVGGYRVYIERRTQCRVPGHCSSPAHSAAVNGRVAPSPTRIIRGRQRPDAHRMGLSIRCVTLHRFAHSGLAGGSGVVGGIGRGWPDPDCVGVTGRTAHDSHATSGSYLTVGVPRRLIGASAGGYIATCWLPPRDNRRCLIDVAKNVDRSDYRRLQPITLCRAR
jgi:hypothetical protein